MLLGKNTIGTCTYLGGVMALPEPFAWSWSQMIQYNNEFLLEEKQRIEYTRATVSWHPFARNTLVEKAQGDWLLMLDTDHQFEPDLLARMLMLFNKYNLDVLISPYVYKSHPYVPVLYGWNPKTKGKYIIGDWERGEGKEVMRIWGAGAGCLLVRRKVFEKIKKKLKQEPFDCINSMSEDHSFFERCWKLKIPCFAAMNIEYPHMVYRKLTIEDDYDLKNMAIDYKNKVILDKI